ncbi:linear amide C-N hydrolase [Vibrio comitans]|uniref:Hydrolase n=1 Tax=Vibrio comitans NBRC 102076 TaxID=1219078 RepID=A0A4Y3IMW8_9VIBR|nr:linear amide C-N hydrolase [Vibrio comitans]GEA60833.1 hydrolase [Vibrio comitans NBRC 102076]
MIKNIITLSIAATVAATSLLPNTADACTRMLWNTNNDFVIVGRNEDYFSASAPTLVKTPHGVSRKGSNESNTPTISWTVKYGSVVAYANNRFPMDGMNEKGLTARTLYFNEGDIDQHAATDTSKPVLQADHWVSYILDNFSNIEDAVNALKQLRLTAIHGGYSYVESPKHLSMADASGDSAIIEIQNGELKIFHGKQYTVMTNPPNIQTQMEDAHNRAIDANDGSFPSTWGAEDRFQKAQYWLNNMPNIKPSDGMNAAYGFMYSALGTTAFVPGIPLPEEDKAVGEKILKHTKPEDSYGVATYLQSISDLTNRHYRFKSLLAPADVYLDLNSMDWSAQQKVAVIPRIDRYAQQGLQGNIAEAFTPINEPDIYQQNVIN